MLSLAAYLDRHGHKVLVDNLGDRMVDDITFDVEAHLRNMNVPIFAVGLHFQQHSQGAIEIAALCKKLHPHSLVILGGLTATRFHEEILRKYSFIDAVVRGEAENPFLQLVRTIEVNGELSAVPNLTYRTPDGQIQVTPLLPPVADLDEFEYTRLDFLESRTAIFGPESIPRWSLEVCRGCIYNCAICGGSAYTYRTYLGRKKPAFRSPPKIIQDIRKLNDQGIKIIGLYQDPRMGGERYWKELLMALRTEKLDFERLSLDLQGPANEDFIKDIAAIPGPVTLHICPDTGCDSVRRKLGRLYSNEDLLRTVRLCHKYFIPVTSFFSVGLAGETTENIRETWELSAKLAEMEQICLTHGSSWGVRSSIPLGGPIAGPILLDPGSLAFDFPEKYGYKLVYKNLEEYIAGLSLPSWHQWLNYETDLLDREALIELILKSQDFFIDERKEYGFATPFQADVEHHKLRGDIIALHEVERILKLVDPQEREAALKSLRAKLDTFLQKTIHG